MHSGRVKSGQTTCQCGPESRCYPGDVAKQRVGILFGGRSTEHEVSINSATAIADALDPILYDAVLIGIDHDGSWTIAEPSLGLEPSTVLASQAAERSGTSLRDGLALLEAHPVDVLFPIIHGQDGEDGVLQGVLQLIDVPYVGSGVAGAALCMDKILSKRVLRDAGIPVLPHLERTRREIETHGDAFLDEIEDRFEYPVFIKPANTGSSIGVHRATDRASLRKSLSSAARYDTHVLVEPGLDAQEVECAVLGGTEPRASVPGEIRTGNEFYDYEAKYVSDNTQLLIPAEVSDATRDEIQTLAVKAFLACRCWGMARVDFFVTRRDQKIYLNELNTHPGFTTASLYPRMWAASGLETKALIGQLIELALERHRERGDIETRYGS